MVPKDLADNDEDIFEEDEYDLVSESATQSVDL